MDPGRSSGDRSGNSGEYGHEIAESLRFQEEIQSLMTENESGAENGSSFTALLGLPPNQAMELLHDSEIGDSPAVSPPGGCPIWRLLVDDPNGLAGFPLGTVPTFPSNTDLVERAARLSVFAAEDSPQTSSSKVVKTEPAVSDSNPDSSPAREPQLRPPKRKEPEKSKAKGSAKRSKSSLEKSVPKPTEEKLPYVHVRARRGQATDSHSLAERARREKINARMKLLQELVPGCSKISGTALVLDEIINHVQSLQRQVEFLSMRLAAVNPRIDFSGLDSFLSAEGRAPVASGVGGGAGPEQSSSPWDDTRRQQHQIWQVDFPPAPPLWWRGDAEQYHELAEPRRSLLRYDSVNSVCLRSNQLKQEL